MKNPVKSAFYVGVCAAAVSAKLVEHHVKELTKRHGISEKEGQKIVNAAMKKMRADAKHVEAAFKKEVKRGLKEAKPIAREAKKLASELAVEMVKEALEETPAELAGDLVDHGIITAGGGALLRGLEDLLREETDLPVERAADPLTCVVMGACRYLEVLDDIRRDGPVQLHRLRRVPAQSLSAGEGD